MKIFEDAHQRHIHSIGRSLLLDFVTDWLQISNIKWNDKITLLTG